MSTFSSRLRIRAVGVTLALAATTVGAAYAQSSPEQPQAKASKQTNIGVFTGLAIGAAAGGPIGAIVGAAAGGWLGERYHRQLVVRESLKQDLVRSEAEKQDLALRLTALDDSLHASQAQSERLGGALSRAQELSMQVSFRTDDSELATEDVARVQELAGLAAALPAVKIQIDGYADPRGSQDYNQKLSEERADEVAQVLKQAGIDPQRLIVQGHGASEAHCAQGDLDGYALERRVTVRMATDAAATLARAP